jgi:hypothetical protein
MKEFVGIQRDIIDLLSDGRPHDREELITCIKDEFATRKDLNQHLTAIRKKIQPAGHDIVCVLKFRRVHYQHVMLLPPNHDE